MAARAAGTARYAFNWGLNRARGLLGRVFPCRVAPSFTACGTGTSGRMRLGGRRCRSALRKRRCATFGAHSRPSFRVERASARDQSRVSALPQEGARRLLPPDRRYPCRAVRGEAPQDHLGADQGAAASFVGVCFRQRCDARRIAFGVLGPGGCQRSVGKHSGRFRAECFIVRFAAQASSAVDPRWPERAWPPATRVVGSVLQGRRPPGTACR